VLCKMWHVAPGACFMSVTNFDDWISKILRNHVQHYIRSLNVNFCGIVSIFDEIKPMKFFYDLQNVHAIDRIFSGIECALTEKKLIAKFIVSISSQK